MQPAVITPQIGQTTRKDRKPPGVGRRQASIERRWPTWQDMQPAGESLLELLSPENFPEADFSRMHAMGFSQGAAFLYTIALLHPERVRALVGLSGFLPEKVEGLIARRHPSSRRG